MKILFLVNVAIDVVLQDSEKIESGSWVLSYIRMLQKEHRYQIILVAPDCRLKKDSVHCEAVDKVDILRFSYENSDLGKSNEYLEHTFAAYLQKHNPDIIHLFGTEYSHALSMYLAAAKVGLGSRAVLNMQGSVGQIAKHYRDGLPASIVHRRTLRDLALRSSIIDCQRNYEKGAVAEERLLRQIEFVIGRTEWDKLCVTSQNPRVKYFDRTEIIRPSFFDKTWSIDNCNLYQLFVSQASYPVKGLHYLLRAFPQVIAAVPNVKVCIAGPNILAKNRIRDNSYTRYIRVMIHELDLSDHVVFVGPLSEDQMVQMYLSSHLYILCSQIENESNSLSEAMICGMPVLAPYVGGLTGRIKHGVDGLFYPQGDIFMLAQHIKRILQDYAFAVHLGKMAGCTAAERFQNNRNFKKILKVYDEIVAISQRG